MGRGLRCSDRKFGRISLDYYLGQRCEVFGNHSTEQSVCSKGRRSTLSFKLQQSCNRIVAEWSKWKRKLEPV
jgi:hypothetical protein